MLSRGSLQSVRHIQNTPCKSCTLDSQDTPARQYNHSRKAGQPCMWWALASWRDAAVRSREGGTTRLERNLVPGPWQLSGGISKTQQEPCRGRVQDRLSQEAHSPLEAWGTVAASLLCLGENQTCKEGMGAGTKGQRTGKQKAEGLPWPRRKRQAGKAEGRPVRQRERAGVVTKGRRAGPAQRRDTSLTRGILLLADRSTG